MTYAELVRKLRRMGLKLDEQGKRHEIWYDPATGRRTRIPRHRTREVPEGTLKAILRDLGLKREDLI